MSRQAQGELAFFWHRGFILAQALLGPLFTVVSADALIFHRWLDASTMSSMGKVLLGISLFSGIAVTVAGIRGLLHPKPVLYTDNVGFWINPPEANFAEYQVPWAAIRRFELRVDEVGRENPKHWIELQIDPAAWKAPERLFDPSRTEVQINLLNKSPQDIFHALRMRWRRACPD